MDILHSKRVNPKMQSAPKSPINQQTGDKQQNLAYCDIDIMAAYQSRKKHRNGKTKHAKEHTKDASKSSRSDSRKMKVEQSELSKKIEDLTARNEQIKQLLVNSSLVQDGGVQAKTQDGGRDEKKKSHHHREREHKSRRSTHQATQDLISQTSSRPKRPKEQSDLGVTKVDKQKIEEKDKPKHRNRKERSFTLSEPADGAMAGHNHSPNKITLRLRNHSNVPNTRKNSKEPVKEITKESLRERNESRNEAKHVPDSKSQLVRLTNYPITKSVESKPTKHDIITVYENDNILEETDSIVSKDDTYKNTLKSKTYTQASSFTQDTSSARYDAFLEHLAEKLVKPNPPSKIATKDTEPLETSPLTTITARKELSFSNLNLQPNIYHYVSPAKMATTQTSVSRIESPGYGSLGIGVHSSLLEKSPIPKPLKPRVKEQMNMSRTALRDILKVHELEQQNLQKHSSVKSKFYENTTYHSDDCSKLRPPLTSALSKNSRFHKKRCDNKDRIVEVASKTCRDQKVTFTVEGVEPVKRLQKDNESTKSLKIENVFNMQVFPGITITQENIKQEKHILNHGVDNRSRSPRLQQQLNESMDNFDGSGTFYDFGNTISECKPKSKESSEVSYKFKKRYWSNKEIPKVQKSKEKKKSKNKSKSKVMKLDMGVQTRLGDSEEHTKSDRDVGVSTGPCHSHEVQVQVALPVAPPQQSPQSPSPSSLLSKVHSESNISIFKEKYIRKTDFPEYKEIKPKVVTKIPTRVPKPEVKSSSGESYRPVKPFLKPMPVRKQRSQRSRKYQNTQNTVKDKDSRKRCHSVMSTGSIRNVPEYPRKTRSKSLTHDRDSLAEKIKINKETIKHHHQEIAALEKCLNEILHRLGQEDSVSKVAVRGDESSNDTVPTFKSERSNLPSYGTMTFSSSCHYQEGRAKLKQCGTTNKTTTPCRKNKSKSKTSISMSKFHRAKAYNDRLRRRHRRSKEQVKGNCIEAHVYPVKVRSVYKNVKGFISSATSMSSKLSDLGSSSPCPQSIPSLNIGYSVNLREESSSGETRRFSKYHKNGIVKKKHKLYPKYTNYSKKKTRSIYDLLKHYINLTTDRSTHNRRYKPKISELVLTPEESNIVVLSVSSVKLKPLAHSKEPFFIGKTAPALPQPQKVKSKKKDTSEDSLESGVRPQRKPDLCPLTAIFNFEPPKRDYLVYNMEVVSPNKPKVVVKPSAQIPGQSQSPRNISPQRSETLSTGSKLMTILEENPLPTWDVPPQLQAKPTTAKPNLQVADNSVSNLSPVLSRRAYPTYEDCIKSLEKIEQEIQDKPKTKLTSFNCNDRECSNLIFKYTSKKDAKELQVKSDSKPPSSAYHTMTTIMDSRSMSLRSASESDTAINQKNESGYESSNKKSSFKNFFKSNLLDVFKTKIKKKKSEAYTSITESQPVLDNRTPVRITSQESLDERFKELEQEHEDVVQDLDEDSEHVEVPFTQESKTVLWFNFRKKKRDTGHGCDPWCANRSDQTEGQVPAACSKVCHKQSSKCMSTTWKNLGGLVKAAECPCSLDYEKQRQQCKKYASKVLMEASEREKGYMRQYQDFEEMPLKVLMGTKKCPCHKMKQSCTKTYANKVAGIQVKQPQKSEHIQAATTPSATRLEDSLVPVGAQGVEVDTPGSLTPLPRSPSSVISILGVKLADIASDEFSLNKDTAIGGIAPSGEEVSGLRMYTDKEIFDRLLRDYERRDALAERLTADEVFTTDMYEAANSGVVPDLQVEMPRPSGSYEERMRSPRFSDKPRPLVHVANADTTVRPDDIGTCFARGFRPDNLMLSGDACFHINKQDKVKMSPYMLKSTESIIDFSERETPLDFLLALGFMVDEASNALKDDDIRSRLLAAITEARVWINKITTTQGTLLYLVAYKARPETMRYFLQLVEAIINKRITNAIRLDGFLRVLEDVEAGRVQMINILGEDKFEDEENEEKIVKKQLKNLFITVFNVAEKEAGVSGRTLTQGQIALLRILVAKYRAGLHPHLELIARYVGQGLLENEIQLEAAMIFLSRLDTTEVKLKEFENYCGIACQLQD